MCNFRGWNFFVCGCASLEFIEFVQRQKNYLFSHFALEDNRDKKQRSMLSSPSFVLTSSKNLEWISFLVAHRSGVKDVTWPEGCYIHTSTENNDWFDCCEEFRETEEERDFGTLRVVERERWEYLGFPSIHIFMSTLGDPFELVFTTDSLFFFSWIFP